MKNYGLAHLSDFLGDRVIYRNLAPCDPALPALDNLRPRLGLPDGAIPRKNELDYAKCVAAILVHARSLLPFPGKIERILFLGDTRLLDTTAFENICAAGGWPGAAFIASEDRQPPTHTLAELAPGRWLFNTNRWSALTHFDTWLAEQGFSVDANTAVLIDIDKTSLGARGRNAATIDRARVTAVRQTVAGLLGESFSAEAFETRYTLLNQPEFHSFTGDNQDYLAYICLALGGGIGDLDTLVLQVRSGEMTHFSQFIQAVENQKERLAEGLRTIHSRIFANVQRGDPTPFKEFRRQEYLETIQSLGFLPDTAPVEQMLADEIVITQEVYTAALDWAARGALLLGLSDKPDEAALPTPELAAQGWLPLHHKATHSIGEAVGGGSWVVGRMNTPRFR